MSYDDSDDLAYNPFAEDDEQHSTGSGLAQGYYSSAFFPKPSSPTLRRRRSSLSSKSDAQSKGERKRHSRSRTEIKIPPPTTPGLHPLKSALAATIGAVLPDTGVTRPNLSRLVNESYLVDAPKVEDGDSSSKSPTAADAERDVLVHEVSSRDSLAGVSLKYGISLANLRRANQLWTSDSIHRRSVLYIPIDQASRAREYVPEPKLISLTPDPSEDNVNVFDDAYTSPSSLNANTSDAVPPQPTVPVVRVRAGQLTYFPPASNKSPDPTKLNGHSSSYPNSPSSAGSKTSPTSNRYDPSLPNNSLTSILTALPIAASTRDEWITRLSLDSVSSSFTDRSRANSDEENGHELGEVRKTKRTQGRGSVSVDEDMDESLMPTPKARPKDARFPVSRAPQPSESSSLSKASHIRSFSSTSATPPHFYVSQHHEAHVRTSQMEPSPGMRIPIRRSNTVGPSRGKLSRGTIGVERTSSLGTTKVGENKDEDPVLQRMQANEFH